MPRSLAVRLRRATFTLIDRNLLLGVGGCGVKQHDIVREFARSQLRPTVLRQLQRSMVRLLLQRAPEKGWQLTSKLRAGKLHHRIA